MGPNLLIITRFGPIGINAENYHPIIHIIKRAGPNYYVRKGVGDNFFWIYSNGNGPKSYNHYRLQGMVPLLVQASYTGY